MVKEYQKNWAAMEVLFTSFQGSERFDIDMLDALLCSGVQAVAETTLGIYKPQEARKKDDNVAKELATQLDMPASIQLLKCAQHASTASLQLISSTPQSTPIQECNDHYSKIFNLADSCSPTQPGPSRAPLTEMDSSPPPASPASPLYQPAPSPQSFQPPDESNPLASGLLDHISIDKINVQLGPMSSSASCSSDGITVIISPYLLITTFPKQLHQLYLACIQKGQTPRRWNDSLVYPLCKDRKKPYTVENSRPISLICLFRKLFESLILPIVSSSGKMAYSGIQAGFRSGYSTLTNVLTLHHQIEADAGSHIVFLDFAAPFDKVAWVYLERELKAQDINPLVLQLLYQLMFRDMTFSIIVNGCRSPQQDRNCGLLQGSPLSPILFNRFINSLLQSLNWQCRPTYPSALFIANDRVLIAPTLQSVQSLVNMSSRWADQHGISFNIPKCGYLRAHTAATTPLPPAIRLHNQDIPLVTSYKYLGVIFSSKGIDFDAQSKLLCERVERQLGAIRWFSSTWCPQIRYNILKSLLLPTLEYSLPLLYGKFIQDRKSTCWKTLNTAYNNCLLWIAGGAAHRPHITCHLLGLLPFKDRAQQLHSRFYLHLLSMHNNNPLRGILDRNGWYPKSNRKITVRSHHPLLFQFLNPPPVFTPYLPNLQQTPIATLRHDILKDLALQKWNHIRAIDSKSPKLLQISCSGMVTDRVPGLDCDVVLTAPAADQSRFLSWRRGVFGWGRKCVCGERFDRGHTRCMPYPDPGLTDEQQFILDLDRELLDPGVKYLIVDFLLNKRLWDKARMILDFWALSMSNLLRANSHPQ